MVPRIEASTLSGLGRHTLVDSELIQPVSLVLDTDPGGGTRPHRVYWVDAVSGAVSSITTSGTDRQTHFTMEHAGFRGMALSQVITTCMAVRLQGHGTLTGNHNLHGC